MHLRILFRVPEMAGCEVWARPVVCRPTVRPIQHLTMGRSIEELRKNAAERRAQLISLFNSNPVTEFPGDVVELPKGEPLKIDVLAFEFESDGESAIALVTSGMSEYRMANRGRPAAWVRHEIIQYVSEATAEHAEQLAYLAWLPHFDEFALSQHHTIDGRAQFSTNEWRNAFFVSPIIEEHDSFRLQIDGDVASLISFIPISDVELVYKRREGHEALLTRMDEKELPWIFSAGVRKPLVSADEVLIPVFVPTLASLLQMMENKKGSALNQDEVLQIRDKGACIMMKLSDAQKLAESRGYSDIDPDFCWQQWQEFRAQVEE